MIHADTRFQVAVSTNDRKVEDFEKSLKISGKSYASIHAYICVYIFDILIYFF